MDIEFTESDAIEIQLTKLQQQREEKVGILENAEATVEKAKKDIAFIDMIIKKLTE